VLVVETTTNLGLGTTMRNKLDLDLGTIKNVKNVKKVLEKVLKVVCQAPGG
jgi:altronate dehydratase